MKLFGRRVLLIQKHAINCIIYKALPFKACEDAGNFVIRFVGLRITAITSHTF